MSESPSTTEVAGSPSDDSPRRLSLWAAASLPCSLLICPPMCLIGAVLGVVGLIQTRKPAYRGRGLAVAGVSLGLLFTIGWVIFGVWWNTNVRPPLLNGPKAALARGFAGDTTGFQLAFVYEGPVPDEQVAITFINELRQRYGDLRDVRQAAEAPWDDPSPDRGRVRVPYVFDFAREDVVGEAMFVITEPAGGLTLKWRYVAIRDATFGDLVYPPDVVLPSATAGGPDGASGTDDDGQ
jgi:hypothetical protein